MTNSSNLIIYGATGYTGTLIARFAVERGLQPILASRNGEKVKQLATELGLEHRAFSLEDETAIDTALTDMAVVLNCAGPFSKTYQPMSAACLRTNTHYLDITGEIAVFEAAAAQDAGAKAAGVMLLPGVGFDVVPSDCLAAHLKQRLPDATHLALGIQLLSRPSRGTATTMVEGQAKGGFIRRAGAICRVPGGWKTRSIDFGRGAAEATTIPWGDVSTAYYSTGIPNIEVYAALGESMRWAALATRYFGWFLGLPAVQDFQKSLIQKMPAGPTDEERKQGISLLWGEVENSAGNQCISRLQCPEGYTLTALTALAVVEKVLAGQVKAGFQTPSLVYGADLIMEIEGVMREDIK